MTVSISIKPVIIIGHRFSDGERVYEAANHKPVAAWGIFIDDERGTTSGLAVDRATAVAAATELAKEEGFRIIYIAPEDGTAGEAGTVQ